MLVVLNTIIVIFQQRFVRLSKYLTEMGMGSSQSRSWGWPCALWATCPMRWSWRLSSKDLIWMVSVSLFLWFNKLISGQAAAYNPMHKLDSGMMCCCRFLSGDGQVGFEEFVTLLGPKLSTAGMPDKFNGADFDSVFWKVCCQYHFQHNYHNLSIIDSSIPNV